MKTESAKTTAAKPSDAELLDLLRKKEGPALVARREKEILEERTRLVAELRAITKKQELNFIAQTKAIGEARLKLIETGPAFAVRDKLLELSRKQSLDCLAFDRERGEIVIALLATASPTVPIFIRELRDDQERTRKIPPDVNIGAGGYILPMVERNPVTGRVHDIKREPGSTRYERVQARIAAINEAIAAAEEMQFDPDQTTVPERLEKLRQTLPAVRSA